MGCPGDYKIDVGFGDRDEGSLSEAIDIHQKESVFHKLKISIARFWKKLFGF